MKRRSFFKDISFAVIASLLPKILQPAVPEVAEEMIEITLNVYTNPMTPDVCYRIATFGYWLPKKQVELIHELQDGDVRLKKEYL